MTPLPKTSRPAANAYLQPSEAIDSHHPQIVAQAKQLAAHRQGSTAIAQACYEWVRDEIRHSFDYQINPVTWRASDVLRYKTGYCFAKSHLLAALLRANQIPAGFCYQRLSVDDRGAPYSLHGFNAVYLPQVGWYRVDPRGNKAGVNAQFNPPYEQLAYRPKLSEEADFTTVLEAPLPAVLQALKAHTTWDAVLSHLPDIDPVSAKRWGLTQTPNSKP